MWARVYLASDSGRNIGADKEGEANFDKVFLNIESGIILVNEQGSAPYVSSMEKMGNYTIGFFTSEVAALIEKNAIGAPRVVRLAEEVKPIIKELVENKPKAKAKK